MIKSNRLSTLMLAVLLSVVSFFTWANDNEIENLKQRLKILEQQQITDKQYESKVYATFRPSLTYADQREPTTDVTDFLSHAGLYLEHEVAKGWSALAHGEWSIDIANNGNFGKARRAYVGFNSPYGRVAIGKQRPVQYLLIAEYVDIFNHANAPFAYDNFSPFFVDNLVSYKQQWQNVSLLASAQFNGDEGSNSDDMLNVGLSYDHNNLHVAATYLSQKIPLAATSNEVGHQSKSVALSAANSFANGVYLAGAWQQRKLALLNGVETTQSTVDVSLAYQMSKANKLKLGYFELDDDTASDNNQSYQGFNATLEHKLSKDFQIHIELLTKTFDMSDDYTALSVGFKYNFSKAW